MLNPARGQTMNDLSHFQKLVELVGVLRGPQGCPWDQEQTHETLKPLLIEEAYEVLEALDDSDSQELCDELGDLLFQVIFHSCIASEKEEFDINDVCRRSYEKMVGRHPHVFGESSYKTAQELLKDWEEIKATERKAVGKTVSRKSLLDGIPSKLPSLYFAYQISSKAARVGFGWENIEGIKEKLLEECEELCVALEEGDEEKVKDEMGDLLFSAVNMAQYLQVDPETALNRASRKFSARFKAMEEFFSEQGKVLKEVDTQEMEICWQEQKRRKIRKTTGSA